MRRKSRKSTHWKRSGDAKTPVGDPQPVAVGELLDQRGRDRALEVDVQLRQRQRHTRPSRTGRSAGGSALDVDRRQQRGGGLGRARVAARVDDRQRAVRADLGADRGDLRQPDAVVDLVVLAAAVAAQGGDDEPDGARVDARRRSRGARARPDASRSASGSAGFSTKSAGPPSAATIAPKRSAAAPASSTLLHLRPRGSSSARAGTARARRRRARP